MTFPAAKIGAAVNRIHAPVLEITRHETVAVVVSGLDERLRTDWRHWQWRHQGRSRRFLATTFDFRLTLYNARWRSNLSTPPIRLVYSTMDLWHFTWADVPSLWVSFASCISLGLKAVQMTWTTLVSIHLTYQMLSRVNHSDSSISIGVFTFASMCISCRLALTVAVANILFACRSLSSATEEKKLSKATSIRILKWIGKVFYNSGCYRPVPSPSFLPVYNWNW